MLQAVTMRVLPYDLSIFLKVYGDPIGVLRAVNLSEHENWKFHIGLDSQTKPFLEIFPPNSIELMSLLDGCIPELHWGESITIQEGSQLFRIEPLTGKILSVQDLMDAANSQSRRIRVEAFCGNYLRSIWSDREAIRKFLDSWTWLGVPKSRNVSVKWKCVSQEFDYSYTNQDLNPVCAISSNDKAMKIFERPFAKESEVRHEIFGVLTSSDFAPLVETLRRLNLQGCLIYLEAGWKFILSTLGQVHSTEKIAPVVDEFRQLMQENSALIALSKERRLKREILEADRLTARLELARNADRVKFKNKLLGTVPNSEAGASAIFHKLEAMEGLPFSHFRTIAWAGADGIDAIADIQYDPNEPIRYLQPIEYEFKFENFLLHQHPHSHVELVVCWDNSPLLEPTSKPWLFRYGHAKFSVLVITAVPGLEIAGKE